MPETIPVTIFSAQHLITLDGDPLSPGALAVQGDEILKVDRPEVLQELYPQASIKLFPHQTLLPGLVNAHTDLSLTLFNKFTHPPIQAPDGSIPLMRWVVYLSRFKSELAIPDQQRAIQGGLSDIRAQGVTTIGDICRYPAAIPLYENSGMRVVCLAEIENIQRNRSQEDFEQALALVDEIQNGNNTRVTSGLAPFSAYTLSKNLLKIITDHALQQDIPLHLHGALSFSEMEFFYDSLGEITAVLFKEAGWDDKTPPPHRMTPVQYLYEIGVLRAQPTLVGCLHLGPTDSAILERQKCSRLFCPKAFAHLQVGEIPMNKVLSEKAPWALGTWGKAWGGGGDIWDEMRSLLYEVEGPDRILWAEGILKAATLGGAHSLKLDEKIGSLTSGKQADFIVVDTPEEDESLLAGLIDQMRPEGLVASYVSGQRAYERNS